MKKVDVFIKERKTPIRDTVKLFGLEKARKVMNYHRSFAEYSETPLVKLPALAEEIGVSSMYVKDESKRFDLNAFKVLGGSYGIANSLAERFGLNIDETTIDTFKTPEMKEKLKDVTFITATDGNHGRGIAWTAKELGCRAVIYMPCDTVESRVDHIKKLGVEAHKTDMHFDDTARFAFEESKRNGWIMVQDTTFEGYTDFPTWCMQGYTTMSCEAYDELERQGVKPTHIFIQAGAGSLAGSVAGFFGSVYGEDRPLLTTVEASNCGCIKATAEAGDNKLHKVGGDLKTIMAGLSVGEACSVGWDVLDEYADAHAVCGDSVSAEGMRVLAAPKGDDLKIVSGESGSVGVGMVVEVMSNPELEDVRKNLQLDENSVVLCFNTEGDTDPENYRKIVWGGAYPNNGGVL